MWFHVNARQPAFDGVSFCLCLLLNLVSEYVKKTPVFRGETLASKEMCNGVWDGNRLFLFDLKGSGCYGMFSVFTDVTVIVMSLQYHHRNNHPHHREHLPAHSV